MNETKKGMMMIVLFNIKLKLFIFLTLFVFTSSLYSSVLTDTIMSTFINPIIDNISIVFIALLGVALAIFGVKKIMFLFNTSEALYSYKREQEDIIRENPAHTSFFQTKDNPEQKINRENQYQENYEIKKFNHQKVKSLRAINHEINNLTFEFSNKSKDDYYSKGLYEAKLNYIRHERDEIISSSYQITSENKSYKNFDENRGNKYSYQSHRNSDLDVWEYT